MELSDEDLKILEALPDSSNETDSVDDMVYNKSLDLVRESMKSVIQEMILLIDDQPQLVYIHSLNYTNGAIEFDYSTMSKLPEDILLPHIQKCLEQQLKIPKSKKSFNLFKGR